MATLRSILAEPDEIEGVWGPWVLDADVSVINLKGASKDQEPTHLLYGDGPWGIPLDAFKTAADLGFWAEHVAGKGWADEVTLGWLVRAYAYLNGGE